MTKLYQMRSVLLPIAIAWLVIAGFVAFEFSPMLPHSTAGWIALVVFGPPLYVFAELFWSAPIWKTIPSGLRILAGVIIGSAYVFVLLLVTKSLNVG